MKWSSIFFLFLFVLTSCTTEKKIASNFSKYVNEDAIFALEIKNHAIVKDSLAHNDVLIKVGAFPKYEEFRKHLKILNRVPQDTPGLLVFSRTAQDSLGFLYITNRTSDLFTNDTKGLVTKEEIPVDQETITRYEFNNTQLFARIVENEILIGSSLDMLLKDGKLPKPLESNAAFDLLYQTSDKNKALTLYLNLKNKDVLLSTFLSDLPNIAPTGLKNWTTFDIIGGKNQLKLNGVGRFTKTLPSKLSLFKNTSPVVNATPSFAPKQSNAIISYSFDNYATFSKNQQQYLDLNTTANPVFNTVEEIGIMHVQGEKVILLNTFGTENIADFLVSNRKSASEIQGKAILELSKVDFLNSSFQPLIQNFQANYCTILENAFIFSKSKEILQTVISKYNKGETFLKNQHYKRAMNNAAEAATMLSVSDGSHAKYILEENLEKASNLEKADISKFTIVSQIVADGELFHANISAMRKDVKAVAMTKSSNLVFELEHTIATTPQFVTNHLNKQQEIIVQDVTNQLYLFSNTGELLWKKQLNSKIQGKIHQVDVFKNDKLQLAFTTKNEFLVIDRNGNNVKRFDKYFEGEPLQALAIFDYDKKREYRFVVTQKDKVYMYDRKGKIVSGFKYTKATAPIREAPQHMVIGKKDYLTFLLTDGTFRALNRKGELRVKAKENIEFSNHSIRLHKNSFTITDKNNKLCHIDVKGNVKRIGLGLNDFHKMDANSKMLVYLNDNVLSVNGKKKELELGAYTQPRIVSMGKNTYISITDIQNQKIYVFDSALNLLPSFPLHGVSETDFGDINNDGKTAMVAANSEKSLVVYQLN